MEALVPKRRSRPRYSQRIRAAAIPTPAAASQNFSIRRRGLPNSETSTEAFASTPTRDGSGAASELTLASICVGDVAVTATGQRLDESRRISGIVQRLTQAVDGVVQTVIEINERVVRPEHLAEFIARDHVSGMFQQHRQNLKRLILQPDSSAVLEEFSCAEINGNRPEAGRLSGPSGIRHRGPSE